MDAPTLLCIKLHQNTCFLKSYPKKAGQKLDILLMYISIENLDEKPINVKDCLYWTKIKNKQT